jgi:double-strand break repair protein MRE11
MCISRMNCLGNLYGNTDSQVDKTIAEAKEEWASRNPAADCPLPLIRLKVDYSGNYTPVNPQRFGHQYSQLVANPKDMLVLFRKRMAQGAIH